METIQLMAAVTNNRVESVARLLTAGACSMVPVNHFEDCSVMHQIIYVQAYLEDGSVDAKGRLPLLAIMLRDLLKNPY